VSGMAIQSKRVAARARACAFAGLSALLMAACGGGGCGSPAAGEPAPASAPRPAPDPNPAPTASVSIVGTAATGAPLAGAAISLKCVGGDFSASADANGAYRIASVPVDAAPCLLRAQQGSDTYIAPVANPGAGTININATPLTHL